MKLKKKLKYPNAKGPLDKFAPIFAAVGLSYAVINGGFSVFDWIRSGANQKASDKEIKEYIRETVNTEIYQRFPPTTGGVVTGVVKNGSDK